MSSDQLPADFAPIHLVRTDAPVAQGLGRYFNLQIALHDLDAIRRTQPEHGFALVNDGGVIDDSKIEREPLAPFPDLDVLRQAAVERLPAKPFFKIVRKAA